MMSKRIQGMQEELSKIESTIENLQSRISYIGGEIAELLHNQRWQQSDTEYRRMGSRIESMKAQRRSLERKVHDLCTDAENLSADIELAERKERQRFAIQNGPKARLQAGRSMYQFTKIDDGTVLVQSTDLDEPSEMSAERARKLWNMLKDSGFEKVEKFGSRIRAAA